MEVYSKASSVSDAEEVKEPCEVQIKSGKKIRACISQALKILQTTKEKVIITGSGPTVTKVITTAEIVKRKVKGLHQQNTLFYNKTEDFWEPKQEGLDRLKVTRNIPSIRILLSKVPLDEKAHGYQAPGVSQPLIQFRDEDIELADEQYEGKSHLRQSPHQHQRTGFKNNRKQKPKSHTKHSNQKGEEKSETEKGDDGTHKDREVKRSVPQSRGTRRKHGGYHGGQQLSKRQHSDKEMPNQKTEIPKIDENTNGTAKLRPPQASS
ncbi:ribonuclease P protein subunit p25-like protein [Actinia tenebrosa]|uniref:Ribonuclease P protein subunit p25-like protein n=1 Tax=Actinia tenebrosa TaxID=6105 RepID=A0A6P8HUX6_ACTTE|nr:ribonuclease P protein subunit p25-like protein [Actinia tenebrosa]